MSKHILYVAHFDSASHIAAQRQGLIPTHTMQAVSTLEERGYSISHVLESQVYGHNVAHYPKLLDLLIALHSLKKGNEVDALIVDGSITALPIAIYRSIGLLRKPVIWVCHSASNTGFKQKMLLRITVRGVDKVIALSWNAYNVIIGSGPLEIDKITHLNYGADVKFYKDSWMCQEVGKYMISIGVKGRDIDTLVKAASLCNHQLLIVGQPSSTTSGQYTSNIQYVGDKPYGLTYDELIKLYQRSCFVVVPTYGTQHPYGVNALVEAMALGKAVVITDGPGIDIDVEALHCGFKVPPHDPISLLNRINFLFDHPSVAVDMGKRARKVVEDTFNTDNMTNTLEKVLSTVL